MQHQQNATEAEITEQIKGLLKYAPDIEQVAEAEKAQAKSRLTGAALVHFMSLT